MSYCKPFLSYLHTCREELEKYMRSDPDAAVSVLRTLCYQTGVQDEQHPDYDDPHIQQLYALRYMYAYGYEYLEMFRRLLAAQDIPPVVKILSIGCGNGVDYWAFREAWLDREDGSRIKYTGLDQADWRMRWGVAYMDSARMKFKNASVEYHQGDAVRFLQENPVLEYSIIIFPKSISEFSEDGFTKLCQAFATAKFQFRMGNGRIRNTRKVHFLISLRKKEDAVSMVDKLRSDRIAAAMEQNGFVLEDANAAETFVGQDEYINQGGSFFCYPDKVKDFMDDLDRRGISYRPIRNQQYICNRVMTFIRKE